MPYILLEGVGQFSRGRCGFNPRYRRAGAFTKHTIQALLHAQMHDWAADAPWIFIVMARGVFVHRDQLNTYNEIKRSGLADGFRGPKLGAPFYQALASPKVKLVIQLHSCLDFGGQSPNESAKSAMIFSNGGGPNTHVDGKQVVSVKPDRANVPYWLEQPFCCELEIKKVINNPAARCDCHDGDRVAVPKLYPSEQTTGTLLCRLDDTEHLVNDVGAAQWGFKVMNLYRAELALAGGKAAFEIAGRGVVLGNLFTLMSDSGGVEVIGGGTVSGSSGHIAVNTIYSFPGENLLLSMPVQPFRKNQFESTVS